MPSANTQLLVGMSELVSLSRAADEYSHCFYMYMVLVKVDGIAISLIVNKCVVLAYPVCHMFVCVLFLSQITMKIL